MAPCEGLSIWNSKFWRQKLETWYLWDFAKGHLKVMIIFRWQARDSRVEIGVSPQRNSNFSHQGLKKNIWFLRFSFGVIWKCPFRLNETHIFDIRTSKKSWTISRLNFAGQHFCHSTPQGVAQSLQIQRVFTLCILSPHIGARPFEPHWIHPIYPEMKNLDFWSVRSISEVQQWPKETHSNVYAANDANYLFTHGCSTSHMLRKPTWRRHAPPHPTPTPCNVQIY